MDARRFRVAAAIAVLVLLAGAVLLLRGASPAATSASSTTVSRPVTVSTSAAGQWTRITPGGRCECADGSTFSFWEHRGDPARVLLFLNGGGVCWDAAMCAFTSTDSAGENGNYSWNLDTAEQPVDHAGIFDLTRADNPFAGYSIVFVGNCTGDAGLGDTAHAYSPTLTVQHRGLVNGTAALDYLAAHYPDATRVVVAGKTSGSLAAPAYGGLVADRLPHAAVTVFGGQSGAWPGNPDLTDKVLVQAWHAYDALPAWAATGDRGFPALWVAAARHVPGITLARFDYAYDPHAAVEVTSWMPGNPPDLLSVIDANDAAIREAGVTRHSYTAPGEGHGIFELDDFYDLRAGGISPAAWLGRLVDGKSPADVRCDPCR